MAKGNSKRKSSGSSSPKSMSKSELVGAIAESTELTRRDVNNVLESLSSQIERSLGRRGSGVFTLPGLVKIERRKVPARKARRGVPNPFKPGELMDVAARPATTKIKVRPLKNLKSMA
jgi:nucleoid DNA-binding protein